MQVIGKYKRFWGSDAWSIKIDFMYDKKGKKVSFSSITVEFKNKSELVNSFEVQDLCSCIQLMSKFSEGFGITSFNRRLANWLAEYFNDNGLDIGSKVIMKCFGRETEDKIDVKVKKMNIASKTFTDVLEYNPDDLLISFDSYYDESQWMLRSSTSSSETIHYPLTSTLVQKLDDNETNLDYKSKMLVNNYNGLIDIKNVLVNNKEEILTSIVIYEFIPNEFKPYTVSASLVAPDKTTLGVFQPLDIKKEESGLKVTWQVDELKINHQVQINYVLKQRIPFILNVTSEGIDYSYVKYIDVNSSEKYNFFLLIPALVENNVFSRKLVTSIEASFPIELETQSILYVYPHYILKIIDQGYFQRVLFSELFIDALFFDQVQFDGALLPVLTLYESFLPHSGSRLVKKIYRQHSFSNPLIMFDFNSNSRETIEIEEQYPQNTVINLLSLGNQTFNVKETSDNLEKRLIFVLSANNNKVKYSLSEKGIPNLEKALSHVQIEGNEDNIEITQNINVESIIDKSNKLFKEILSLKLDPNFSSSNIRLRSFNLKLTEKSTELETEVSDSELDKAFAALQNKESLENLKSKIKSSYESTFDKDTPEILDQISEKPAIDVSPANEQEIEQDIPKVSEEVETSELSDKEMAEVDAFIADHSEDQISSGKEPMVDGELAELNAFVSDYSENKDSVTQQAEDNFSEEKESASEPDLIVSEGVNELSEEPIVQSEPKKTTKIDEQAENEESIVDETIIKNKGKKGKKLKKTKIKKEEISEKEKFIEVFVIYDNSKNNSTVPVNITESGSKALIFNDEQEEELDYRNELSNPTRTYLKIPKNDRYIILVINPKEDLASHVYGRWKKETNYPKYKILLRKMPGTWHLKMQLLESGETFDIKFTTN